MAHARCRKAAMTRPFFTLRLMTVNCQFTFIRVMWAQNNVGVIGVRRYPFRAKYEIASKGNEDLILEQYGVSLSL